MAKYAIGDVHGCYYELMELLDKIEYDKTKDTLYFVGDYFDRGPYPDKVLKWMYDNIDNKKIHFLLGNHEDMMLSEIHNDYANLYVRDYDSDWFYNAGGDTRNKLLDNTTEEQRKKVLNHLNRKSKIIEQVRLRGGKIFYIVHAGLYPPYSINSIIANLGEEATEEEKAAKIRQLWYEYQSPFDLVWIRHEWLFTALCPPHPVIFGHTPVKSIWSIMDMKDKDFCPNFPWDIKGKYNGIKNPDTIYSVLKWNNRIDIDTGCCYGGKLSAYRMDDDKIFQVDASKETIGKYLWDDFPTPDLYEKILSGEEDLGEEDYKEAKFWDTRIKQLGYDDIESPKGLYEYGSGKLEYE